MSLFYTGISLAADVPVRPRVLRYCLPDPAGVYFTQVFYDRRQEEKYEDNIC